MRAELKAGHTYYTNKIKINIIRFFNVYIFVYNLLPSIFCIIYIYTILKTVSTTHHYFFLVC